MGQDVDLKVIMRLRNRVKWARESRQMSQHELGRRTGLTRVTLRAIERDDGYTPNGAVMLKVANALGLSMNDLFWSEAIEAEVAV